MCGRYSLSTEAQALLDLFDLGDIMELRPNYNVAPTQEVPIVRADGDGNRAMEGAHWGLIPFWAKDKKIGARMINARSETLAEKPSFRTPYKRRRCLIPVDGWYEWQRPEGGGKGPKQPFHMRLDDELEPFALAGLWEAWTDKATGEHIESCTIITTEASADLADIHNRMPVILDPADWDAWLDPNFQNTAQLQPLLRPAAEGRFTPVPVSTLVNSVRNNRAELLDRLPLDGELPF